MADVVQMRIPIGSTVNVTFEGSPPFNLSRTWVSLYCTLHFELHGQSWITKACGSRVLARSMLISCPLITIAYADRSQCLTVDGGRPWNQSWYIWDVEPYQDNFTGTPSRQTFQVENDGVWALRSGSDVESLNFIAFSTSLNWQGQGNIVISQVQISPSRLEKSFR